MYCMHEVLDCLTFYDLSPSGRIVAIFGGPRVGYPLHSQEPLELVGCSHTIGFLKYKHQHFIRCLPACLLLQRKGTLGLRDFSFETSPDSLPFKPNKLQT